MITNSINGKLWLSTVLVVLVTLLAVGLFLDQMLEVFYFKQHEREMVDTGLKFARILEDGVFTPGQLDQLVLMGEFMDVNVMVVDRRGLVTSCGPGMGMKPGMHLDSQEVKQVLKGEIVVRRGYQNQFGMAMLTAAVPIRRKGQVVGAVMLYKPVATISDTVDAVRQLLLYAAGASVLVTTLLGYFLSRKLSKPLIQMNQVALRMAQGDFSGKVQVTSSDEVGTLANSFNYLSGQLHRTIEALSQEKDKLANILASMTDGVITFDADGRVLLANPQAEELLGTTITTGSFLSEHLPPELADQVLKQALTEEDRNEQELTIGDKVIAVRVAPLKSGSGTVFGAVAIFQDVTAKREAERVRREFLASVSHELRTPLSFLQGYAEALLDGLANDPQEQEKYLKIILEESLRIRRLVDDLLDLNQMETGHLRLNRQGVSLPGLIKGVLRKFQQLAEEKGISLVDKSKDNVPLVNGDEGRLEQVLVNLLDNALRHCSKGDKIEIVVEPLSESLKVCVADTGSGIPKSELAKIWDSFYKVDKARTRKSAGTGLGLAIVKNIVTAHGGQVNVESQEGQGSIFSFTIPYWRDEQSVG